MTAARTRPLRRRAVLLSLALLAATPALAGPGAPSTAEALLARAQARLDQGRLDEGTALLDRLVTEYPGSELAEKAANLALDTCNQRRDWPGLLARSRAYRANESMLRSADFLLMLDALVAQAQFKIADEHLEAGRFEQAAEQYVALVDEQPTWASADKALFNAAVCYQRARRPMSAITVYERLAELYPKSELAARSTFAAAVLQEQLAYFELAATWYGRVSERYPQSRHAADATLSAAILSQAGGQSERATELLLRFADRYPGDHGAASALRWAGDILRDTGKFDQALAAYRTWLERFGRTHTDDAWIVRLAIARVLLARGDRRSVPRARKELEAIAAGAPKAGTEDAGPQAAAAAEAAFLLAEKPFEGSYQAVLRYRQPGWTIAALCRMGQYAECLQRARTLGVHSRWTQQALARLHDLDQKNYPGLQEILPEAAALHLPILVP